MRGITIASILVSSFIGCTSTDGLSEGMRVAEDFDQRDGVDRNVWAVEGDNTESPKVVAVEGCTSAPNALEAAVPEVKPSMKARSTIRTSMRGARAEISTSVRVAIDGPFVGDRWNYVALAVLHGGDASVWLYHSIAGLTLASCDAEGQHCAEKDIDIDLKEWTRLDIVARFGPEGRATLSINGMEEARVAIASATPAKTSIQLGLDASATDGTAPPTKAWFDDVVLR